MRVRPLDPDALEIWERPAPERSPALRARVAALFERERKDRGTSLFDGPVFSELDRRGDAVVGCFVPYSEWIAQRREPSLVEALAVRPLAVSGLCTVEDQLVFARRAAHVTQDPGCWELAPSGAIDPDARRPDGTVCVATALALELEAELGVPAQRVVERSRAPIA